MIPVCKWPAIKTSALNVRGVLPRFIRSKIVTLCTTRPETSRYRIDRKSDSIAQSGSNGLALTATEEILLDRCARGIALSACVARSANTQVEPLLITHWTEEYRA